MRYLILLIIGIVIVAGCVGNAAYFDQPFKLKRGQSSVIESEKLAVRFMNVAEDSRCAVDVQCVWEGQVSVYVNIVKDNENLGDFLLTSGLEAKTFDSYTIRLVDVTPYPVSTKQTDTSAYEITLIVSRE